MIRASNANNDATMTTSSAVAPNAKQNNGGVGKGSGKGGGSDSGEGGGRCSHGGGGSECDGCHDGGGSGCRAHGNNLYGNGG